MRDTRQTRKTLAIFIVAGAAAVVGSKMIEPQVKKALKVKR